jgi:ribose-phosphate pyrophosphokinase
MEKVVLLADKNSSAWDFALKIQRHFIEDKRFFIPLQEVSIKKFRNNEIDMHVPENVRQKDVYFIHDSNKNPSDWWLEILLLKDLLLSGSASSLSLVLPNMLYSRKDRKEKPHVPISARALAKTISSGVKRIITMDLHAPQIQGFYPENVPLDNLYSFPVVVKYLNENPRLISDLKQLVILSPDAGGVDRARAFAQRLQSEHPVAFIEKRRIKAGEIAGMRIVGDVSDKDVLIVDDIIDSGGTLCKAADLLKQNGAKNIFCYGTHGIFTLGHEMLCNKFQRVMTSNTHYQLGNHVEVIDVSKDFAEAIYRAQKGLSISELYN